MNGISILAVSAAFAQGVETGALEAAGDVTLLGLFLQAGLIVKLVMIGLLTASIWTWAIIIDKGRILADATPEEIAAKTGSGRLDDAFRSLTTGRETRGTEDAA